MSSLKLRRRELIQSLSAASFLVAPLLQSAVARAASPQTKRTIIFFIPGGVYKGPEGNDDYFTYEQMLSPLADLRSETLIVKNLVNKASERNVDEKHGAGMRSMLTGDSRGDNKSPANYTSIDQIIAQGISTQSRYASLEFGVFTENNELSHTRISYRDGNALPPANDPAVMFQRLFGGSDSPMPGKTPSDDAAQAHARKRKKSILDRLLVEIEAIKKVSGASQQSKLDAHLTAIRELEKGVADVPLTNAIPSSGCVPPSMVATPSDLPAIAKLQLDLLYRALACGLTRMATFQWICSGEQVLSYPWLDITDSHHTLQHNQRTAGVGDNLNKAQTWFIGQIGSFVHSLQATAEDGGTMLDHSTVLVCSEMSAGDYHIPSPMPILLIGKGGGTVTPGRTIDAGKRAHNDLLTALVQGAGVPSDGVGERDLITTPLVLT